MATDGLTVAVTGPTGDLGIAMVSALERSRRVKKIVGMARREFDPASQGWKKTEYRQGDVQDQASVRDALKGADVVVHLAFTVIEASAKSWSINVDGSQNVFEAAVAAGDDTIDSVDGRLDVIRCGKGKDTVRADKIDTLTDCESVTRASPKKKRR